MWLVCQLDESPCIVFYRKSRGRVFFYMIKTEETGTLCIYDLDETLCKTLHSSSISPKTSLHFKIISFDAGIPRSFYRVD